MKEDGSSQKDKALAIYFAVRDQIVYNPYEIQLQTNAVRPEFCLSKGSGHCIDKAVLFVASCRLAGIEAKLGMAKVQNHIGTSNFEKKLGTNVLVPHGYAACNLDGTWLKCTPAFNKSLCEKLGVAPLNWDGESDSLFQPYNIDGNQFMEYLEDFGLFESFPSEYIVDLMKAEYPGNFDRNGEWIPMV